METLSINGLTIYFPAKERVSAELIGQACERCIPLIGDLWGLEAPKDLRIYILESSWLTAMFHAAPWRWRPLMLVSMPVWYPRGRRLWQVAGGWQQGYGRRRAVCLKTPRLLAQVEGGIGDRIFLHEDDPQAKARQITCHELTHAFTAHLKLPAWLNEGLAMVTAEQFAGKPMVRHESLALIWQPMEIKGSLSKQAAQPGGMERVLALYARGYWRTRYLEETRPGLLRELLAQPRPGDWDRALAAACNINRDEFWSTLDDAVAAYFEQPPAPSLVSAPATAEVHHA